MSREEEMETYLEKAKVLVEALPYIQRFNRKIIVVKYGGSAMVDEALKRSVIQDVTLLKLVGFKPIIVHGGGKEISRWVSKVGMEPHFVNGLRVTDAETMEIAEMVLGKVGKSLVQLVEELGVKAVSISGKDGGLLQVEKKYSRRRGHRLCGRDHGGDSPRFSTICWKRIFCLLCVRWVWIRILTPTISTRMTRPAPLPGRSTRRSWLS